MTFTVLIAVAASVLVSCGGNSGSTDTAQDEPQTTTSTSAPTTTTAIAPVLRWEKIDVNQGYTHTLELSNVVIRDSVRDARPGYKRIDVEFDWKVTNTTPGRDLPLQGYSPVWVRVPNVNLESVYNRRTPTVAFYGPTCATICSTNVPPGGTKTGHFSFENLGSYREGEYTVLVPEATDLSNAELSVGGVEWKSP